MSASNAGKQSAESKLAKRWINRHYGERYGGICRTYSWYQITAAYEAGYKAAMRKATSRGDATP